MQSSSIPGFVEPTFKDDRMLVDGGVVLPTPVTPLIDNCDFIIAVNITRGVENQPEPSNIVEISTRSRDVSVSHLNSFLLSKANFVIKPKHDNLHYYVLSPATYGLLIMQHTRKMSSRCLYLYLGIGQHVRSGFHPCFYICHYQVHTNCSMSSR